MHGILLDKFTKKILELAATTFAVSAATMLAERLADKLIYGSPQDASMPPMPDEGSRGTVININIHGGEPHIYLDQYDDEDYEDNRDEEE